MRVSFDHLTLDELIKELRAYDDIPTTIYGVCVYYGDNMDLALIDNASVRPMFVRELRNRLSSYHARHRSHSAIWLVESAYFLGEAIVDTRINDDGRLEFITEKNLALSLNNP